MQAHLGLFDTPPTSRQIRFSLIVVGLLIISLPIISALPDVRLRQVDAFIPVMDSVMVLGDLITATLLFAKAFVFRSRALSVLASGYVFAGLMLIVHLLTFPGAFVPGGLLGAGINTTAWVSMFWRVTLPIAIIGYAWLKRADAGGPGEAGRSAPRIVLGILAAIGLAAAATVLATRGHDWLPPLFRDRQVLISSNLLKVNVVLIALQLIAAGFLLRQPKSVLDIWLLVALCAWLVHALLNLQTWGRFTVLFYCQYSVLLFSHLVVMLALVAESTRLYTRLALSTASQAREQDTRLMSLGAVAAAICHEVGQPLAGVMLNANAGLSSKSRSPPDREALMTRSLRAVREDADRVFDVLKSIRAMFGSEPGAVTQFDLNGLVCETQPLLRRELTVAKVALRLELDETLPPIFANKVQIQQVLINLLTNAIESLSEVRSGVRRITICTSALKGRYVLLEVSDTGVGISPNDMERVFQAFFTTKKTGIGLGLSLCRTIIDDHGGRLLAEPNKKQGVTFRLELPCSSLPAEALAD